MPEIIIGNDLVASGTGAPAPVPAPAVPISHQDHPFWHFNWGSFFTGGLEFLKVAATVAPIVIGIAVPGGSTKATQLSNLTGAVVDEIEQELQKKQ